MVLSYFIKDNPTKCFNLNRFSLEFEHKIRKLIDEKKLFDDIVNKIKHQSQIISI